jgi:phage shock protein A
VPLLYTSEMDGISAAASVVALVSLCYTLSEHIAKYIKHTKKVDHIIRELDSEIKALAKVLESVGKFTSQAQNEGEHWYMVRQAIDECGDVLKGLERILEEVKGRKRGSLLGLERLASKSFKFEIKTEEIALRKSQIALYRWKIQLALQVVVVCFSPSRFHLILLTSESGLLLKA